MGGLPLAGPVIVHGAGLEGLLYLWWCRGALALAWWWGGERELCWKSWLRCVNVLFVVVTVGWVAIPLFVESCAGRVDGVDHMRCVAVRSGKVGGVEVVVVQYR